MKILIGKNALLAKKLWRETVSVEKSEITRLAVMADYSGSRTGSFQRWSRKTASLRFLIIDAGETQLTLDAFQDVGFGHALAWLKESDWDVDSAVEQALGTPLFACQFRLFSGTDRILNIARG
ncbi:hypothetical protein [Bradyrhizobium sp.]|uniref:hypothetical protein n=1 Tax=Bradyrhizobium sp. TaxID=376 RepID=UPI0027333E5D|nr:hypothetical protein [Bradyrhizobium sp.]MDP3078491.1 hypothetical protein [Bradyrhizobium sp.]